MSKLSAILENLDELPESIDPRTLFTEKNGKFELTGIEGVKTPADIERLQKALQKEREDHRKARERAALLGEMTPEDFQAMQDELEELRAQEPGKGRPSKEAIDKLVQVEIAKLSRPGQKLVEAAQARVRELEEQLGMLMGEKRQRTLQDMIRAATTGEKGVPIRPEALEDVELYFQRVMEFGEDGQPVTRDGVGVEPGLSPRELLLAIQTGGNRPHWFKESQSAGAGSKNGPSGLPGGVNPFSDDTWNATDASKIARDNPALAKRLISTAKASTKARAIFKHILA